MTGATSEQRARHAARVNGGLVFGVPTVLMLVALVTIPWPPEFAAVGPSRTQVALETLQLVLLYAASGAVTAWRTQVHAMRYQAGTSRGWQGVAEAALVGFALALLYLARGIITRPSEAPPYVIVYGGAAAILGVIVGLVLRTSATMVIKFSWRRDLKPS